jgi:Predicted DNA-binding protein with PD1-like DNA-binding motif
MVANKVSVRRLKPKEELFAAIDKLVQEEQIKGGIIMALVGSLTEAHLRFAGQNEETVLRGPFEIVSATGIAAMSGSHIHIAISDGQGTTFGGHLMPGSLVYTTVELAVYDVSAQYTFGRELCGESGYEELTVKAASSE